MRVIFRVKVRQHIKFQLKAKCIFILIYTHEDVQKKYYPIAWNTLMVYLNSMAKCVFVKSVISYLGL